MNLNLIKLPKEYWDRMQQNYWDQAEQIVETEIYQPVKRLAEPLRMMLSEKTTIDDQLVDEIEEVLDEVQKLRSQLFHSKSTLRSQASILPGKLCATALGSILLTASIYNLVIIPRLQSPNPVALHSNL